METYKDIGFKMDILGLAVENLHLKMFLTDLFILQMMQFKKNLMITENLNQEIN